MATHYHQWNEQLGHYVRITPDIKADITRNCGHPKKQYDFGKPRETRVYAAGERTSQYTGVTYRVKCLNPWQARIKIEGIQCFLGFFATEREAALAYDRQAIKLGRETNILKKSA